MELAADRRPARLARPPDRPRRRGACAAIGLAATFRRWPIVLPLAIVAALPFRIPLHAGGDTANLLVPLYLVIAGGVLSAALADGSSARQRAGRARVGGSPRDAIFASRDAPPARSARKQYAAPGWRPPHTRLCARAVWTPRPRRLLPLVLAAVVLLYALQTLYSPDFSKSLQNVCFFFVPFSLAYGLLRDVAWTRKLLVLVLWAVGIEAVAFVVVGSVEYLSRELFWNDQVIRSNAFHTYFRVNSIFWDPNIYGRYLALVVVVAMAALLWAKERAPLRCSRPWWRSFGWASYRPSRNRASSPCWQGWRSWPRCAGAGAGRPGGGGVVAFGVLVVLFAGGVSKLSPDRLNVDTGGRANLVAGGAELFAKRPLWGYGAGGFPAAYREHMATKKTPVAVSHTEPVTVAAEQGLIGLASYPPARRGPVDDVEAGGDGTPPGRQFVGRAAVLAAFAALLVHTMAYAGFYEDPIAWALLAAAASLAAAPVRTSP